MRIVRGGSAQTHSGNWVKFDIELDEHDLQRILVENDMLDVQLTVRQVFSILVGEAELLVTVKLEQLGAKGEVAAKELSARQAALLDKLKNSAKI